MCIRDSPCPVCGSTEHPSPCIPKEEYKELSQDKIDETGKEAEILRKEQEKLSGEVKSNKMCIRDRFYIPCRCS